MSEYLPPLFKQSVTERVVQCLMIEGGYNRILETCDMVENARSLGITANQGKLKTSTRLKTDRKVKFAVVLNRERPKFRKSNCDYNSTRDHQKGEKYFHHFYTGDAENSVMQLSYHEVD